MVDWKDEIVNFETAKLAKLCGFDIPCTFRYDPVTGGPGDSDWSNINAPTQTRLQRWLREKHNIHVEVNVIRSYPGLPSEYECWAYAFTEEPLDGINEEVLEISGYSSSYEIALERGLISALGYLLTV